VSEACLSSADCNPHLYCDQFSGTCQVAALANQMCYSNDMCDMGLRCKFDSATSTTGTCVSYFSLPDTSRKQ